MVAGVKVVFTEEDDTLLEIFRRKQRSTDDKKSVIENTPTSFMPRGNVGTYVRKNILVSLNSAIRPKVHSWLYTNMDNCFWCI